MLSEETHCWGYVVIATARRGVVFRKEHGYACSFAIMIPSSFHDKNDPTARTRIKFSGVRNNVIINVFKEMILTIGVGDVI